MNKCVYVSVYVSVWTRSRTTGLQRTVQYEKWSVVRGPYEAEAEAEAEAEDAHTAHRTNTVQ